MKKLALVGLMFSTSVFSHQYSIDVAINVAGLDRIEISNQGPNLLKCEEFPCTLGTISVTQNKNSQYHINFSDNNKIYFINNYGSAAKIAFDDGGPDKADVKFYAQNYKGKFEQKASFEIMKTASTTCGGS
jgi:hypothetical protein